MYLLTQFIPKLASSGVPNLKPASYPAIALLVQEPPSNAPLPLTQVRYAPAVGYN